MSANSDIDLALNQLGDIGLYQMRVYLLSCLPVFIAGALTTQLVFTTAIPKHRCFVEECDLITSNSSLSSRFNQSFVQFTIPKVESSQWDKCQRYASNSLMTNKASCEANLFNIDTQISCDQFVFDHTYFNSTVVTEFSLVCSSSWIVQLLQSSFFIGILLGSILNGIIADRYGRRTVFIFIPPVLLLTLFLSALSPNALVFGICLILKGTFVAGIYQSAFVIGIEFLGGRWRFWLGNFHSIVFALGGIFVCLVANNFRDWRVLEISSTFPVMITLSYSCIFPESIRWQISNNKIDAAIRQINRAARTNGIILKEDTLHTIINIDQSKDRKTSHSSIFDLFRHQIVRIWTLALLCIWFVNSLVYYGLSFLSSEFDDNIYYSMSMLSLVEIPGIVLTTFAVEKYSRKSILIAILLIGGVACTVSAFLPPDYSQLRMWLSIFGKSNISGSFSLIYVYTVEIFPTVLRISGLGLCSVFSRIGGMSAPYLLQLEMFGSSFPFLVIGLSSIIAGVVSSLLPETKDKKLPDTLEEVAMLQSKKKSPYNDYSKQTAIATTNSRSTNLSDEETENLLENEL